MVSRSALKCDAGDDSIRTNSQTVSAADADITHGRFARPSHQVGLVGSAENADQTAVCCLERSQDENAIHVTLMNGGCALATTVRSIP